MLFDKGFNFLSILISKKRTNKSRKNKRRESGILRIFDRSLEIIIFLRDSYIACNIHPFQFIWKDNIRKERCLADPLDVHGRMLWQSQ